MSADLQNLPVLVVDDNRHACRLLTTILSVITNSETRTCESPEEAFKLLRSWAPGLILTDFQMTPVNGLAFARELRKDASYDFQRKPILLMTAETPNKALVQEVKAAGIDAMLTKPIVPEALVARMSWALKNTGERQLQPEKVAEKQPSVWTID